MLTVKLGKYFLYLFQLNVTLITVAVCFNSFIIGLNVDRKYGYKIHYFIQLNKGCQ